MAIVLCSQLPASRLIIYGLFSLLLSCLALWRHNHYCFRKMTNESILDDVFALERVMKDNFIVVAAFNMLFFLVISFVKGLQTFFFGALVGSEPQFIREKLMQFVLSRSVFLIGIINAKKWSSLLGWTLWFGCLSCLYSFARMARSRCEQLIARKDAELRQWVRFVGMIVVLTCGVLSLLSMGLKFSYYLSDVTPVADIFGELNSPYAKEILEGSNTLAHAHENPTDFHQTLHILIFIFSNSVLVLALLLRIWLINMVTVLSWITWARRVLPFDKSVWIYNVNTLFDVFVLILHFSNHVHMLVWTRMASLTSPIICVQILISYACLARRIRRHLVYRNRLNVVRREFPLEYNSVNLLNMEKNKNEEQFPQPDPCPICWEPLWLWRRLPCKHCFHETCLTMWVVQDPSCPTCRCRILSQISRRQRRTQRSTVFGTVMRYLFSLFDRINADTPQQTAHNRAERNVVVRLRQSGFARVTGPLFDLSIRVTIGSDGYPQQLRPPFPNEMNHLIPSAVVDDLYQQGEVIQSTTQSRFYRLDGSRYMSWLPAVDIEFSEIEQHVAQIPVNRSMGELPHQNQRQLVSEEVVSRLSPFRSATSNDESQRRHLASMRAQAGQIAEVFPTIPIDSILSDLAVTGVPEVTVDNILAGRVVGIARQFYSEELPQENPTIGDSYGEARDAEPQVVRRGTHLSSTVNSVSSNSVHPPWEIGDTVTQEKYETSVEEQQISRFSSLMAQRKRDMFARARKRFLLQQHSRM